MAAVRDIAAQSDGAGLKIPWRLRLKAWWQGYDLEVRHKHGPATPKKGSAVEEIPPFECWSATHLELLQAVWGEGRIGPGSDDYVLKLVKPFGLNPAMSLLELGAGLGGPARLMAKTFGVWADGLEARHALAAAGMALATKAGLEKKAPVAVFDPENFEGKQNAYDCIFSKDVLFTIEDKARLFQKLELMLKPSGQILFTDFLLPGKGQQSKALAEWSAGEPQKPHPWTLEQYQRALVERNFDVRITEDITEDYRRNVTQGWAAFLSAKGGASLERRLAPTLVAEVDLWTRRGQVLESGDLQVYRIYALRKGTKLMSDW